MLLFQLKSTVQHKPLLLDLVQKIPPVTDGIDCAIEASLEDAWSCVLVATEGAHCWQGVVPDC